jgi:hypothetical protein
MQFTQDQLALFKMVFESPTDDYIRRLTFVEYERSRSGGLAQQE